MRRPQTVSGTAPAYPMRPSLAAPREKESSEWTLRKRGHWPLTHVNRLQSVLADVSVVPRGSSSHRCAARNGLTHNRDSHWRTGDMVSRRALLVSALSGCVAVTACGGGSEPAQVPAPAPPVPAPPVPAPPPVVLPPLITDTEVRVSGDTPFTPGCSGSANGTEYRDAEVEPQVAVNPLNPSRIAGPPAARVVSSAR
jgi:hypothetical protein